MITSPELERVILGACLKEDEAAMELAFSTALPEHFALESHQRIFTYARTLHQCGRPVNLITIVEELRQRKELESVGGAVYVTDLTTGVPRMGERVRDYTERLKEMWRLRQMAVLGEDLALQATGGDLDASSLISAASERLEAIACDGGTNDEDIAEVIHRTLENFETRRRAQRSAGLSFGHADLDAHTGGMMPGFQTALGASSGIGKTTMMCQAILAALCHGQRVEAFLLEPTDEQVVMRLASLLSGVRYGAATHPDTANLTEAERLRKACYELTSMPLQLHANASMTLDEVLGKARVGIHRHGTKLICLDYIQRLKVRSSERDEPLRQRIARASSALADLVKNTACHSLLLSQLNTGRRNGAQALPTMFDFRESSQIENDARLIVLLHREYDEAQGHYTGQGAIMVPKHTFGVPSNLKVNFDPVMACWA